MNKKIKKRYGKKPVNPNFYGAIRIADFEIEKSEEYISPGYVYAPYIITTNPRILIMDENGTREIWQINKWQRVKLWVYETLQKLNKLWIKVLMTN